MALYGRRDNLSHNLKSYSVCSAHFFVVFFADVFSTDFFGVVLPTMRLIMDPLLLVVMLSSPVCSTTVGRAPRGESDLEDLALDSGLTLLLPILLISDFDLLSGFKDSLSGAGSS